MKTEKELNKIGRYITLLLRHKPEKEHLDMDKHGWVSVKQILSRLDITMLDLDFIVDTNNKKRFSYSTSKKDIRANQGHSLSWVDVQLTETTPPDFLYHGTAWKSVESIFKSGIEKRDRLHVHLSEDLDTATSVGKRHGDIYIFQIDTKTMSEDGIKFYLSENGVWLTDYVHPKYLIQK